jgi:hypothetical protein
VSNYRGPGRYRHYKGGVYDVIGVGLEEATLRYVVVYRPASGWPNDVPAAQFWTRPLDGFNAMVPNPAWTGRRADGVRFVSRFVPRFELMA